MHRNDLLWHQTPHVSCVPDNVVINAVCQAESSVLWENSVQVVPHYFYNKRPKALAHFSNWMGALSAPNTSHTAALTSGPMPSPGMSVTFWIFASPGDGT